MRVHKDGYIEASRMEVFVDAQLMVEANVGDYRMDGFQVQLERALGLKIEGAINVRSERNWERDGVKLTFFSDWRPPTQGG